MLGIIVIVSPYNEGGVEGVFIIIGADPAGLSFGVTVSCPFTCIYLIGAMSEFHLNFESYIIRILQEVGQVFVILTMFSRMKGNIMLNARLPHTPAKIFLEPVDGFSSIA